MRWESSICVINECFFYVESLMWILSTEITLATY